MRLVLLFVVVSVAGATLAPLAASAQQLTCEPQSSPLLEITSFHPQAFDAQANATAPESRIARVLCNDRRLLTWTFTSQASVPPDTAVPLFPYAEARVSQDIATRAAFRSLQTAMRRAQIGLLGDCQVELDPRFFATVLEVTWHGRGARSHTFFINSGSATSFCSDPAADLARLLAMPAFPETEPGGSSVVIQ